MTTHTEDSFTNATKKNKYFTNEKIKKLKFIADELNPYEPIPKNMKKRLREFHLENEEDPFALTNKIIIMLEDAISEQHH